MLGSPMKNLRRHLIIRGFLWAALGANTLAMNIVPGILAGLLLVGGLGQAIWATVRLE